MLDNRVIYGNLTLATNGGPVGEPVSVAEAKDQSRILIDAEDHLVESYLEAATAHLDGRDGILARALMAQTWDYTLPCFPVDRWIPLPLAPVQSIVHVKYRDTAGTLQTFSASNYQLSADKTVNPKIHLAVGASWPGTRDEPDAVQIQAVYGYALVPAPIRQAIVLIAAHWYVNREAVGDTVGEKAEIPFGATQLLSPFIRASF